eukprot:gene29789-36889_t
MMHKDRIVSDDYHPVHYSSGAISLTPSTYELPAVSGGGANNRMNNRPNLWQGDDSVIAREERNNMQTFMDDLARSLKEHQEVEAKKQQEEREIILKLKVVNTLFNAKVTFTDALIAAAKRASSNSTEPTEAEKERANEERKQHHMDEQNAIMDAITRSMELEQTNSIIFKTEDFIGESDESDDDDDENDDEFAPPGGDEDDERYQRKLRKRMMRRAIMASATNSERSEKIMSTLADMSTRKMRDKLRNLAKFINSHTSRKIISAWNLIEGRFRQSTYSKTVMTLNSSGLTHPVKHAAIFVSNLIGLLCSSKIKIGYQELTVVLERLGFTEEEILHARKIAALNLVISYDQESKTKQTMQYKLDLQMMMRAEERLVSIDELINIVFPPDEAEREAEFDKIKANRQAEAKFMIEEKRRKDESKEKLELRRRKLMADFETTLEQIQILKGEYTREKHNDFAFLIKYCKRQIEQFYEEQTSKITADIMSYIGMDAFPMAIQDKVRTKKRALLIPAINGGNNPFLKPKNIQIPANNLSSLSSISGEQVASPTGERIDGKRTNSHKQPGRHGKSSISNSGSSTPGGAGHALAPPVASPHNRQTKIMTPSNRALSGVSINNTSGSSSGSPANGAAPMHRATSVVRPTTNENQRRSQTVYNNQPVGSGEISRTPHGAGEKPGSTKHSARHTVRLEDRSESSLSLTSAAPVEPVAPVKPAIPVRERIELFGPPTVMAVLRETVSFGRGLSGYPYRDVVATLQYVASTKLAAFFRGFFRRWRYSAARRKWLAIFKGIKTAHFTGWKVLTKHSQETRDFCWRKLKAWNFYYRRAKFRRNLFRQCFWPFYTWRKYSNASATAREKAHFLVHRVMPTVMNIRVFRAWKGYAKVEGTLNRKADAMYAKIVTKNVKSALRYFHDWARRRRHIRKAWHRKGASMRYDSKFRAKVTPFLIWLTYAKYRKLRRMLGSTKRGNKRARRPSLAGKAGKKPSSSHGSKSKPGSSSSSRSKPGSSRGGSRGGKKKGDTSSVSSVDSGRSAMDDSDAGESNAEGEDLLGKIGGKPNHFKWKRNVSYYFDIHSDGEDAEDIPERLTTLYAQAVDSVRPIPQPQSFEFIESAESHVVDQAVAFYDVYRYVDIWNTFEAACRFHRLAHRVFNNLRYYARIKRRVKKCLNKKRLATKKLYFSLIKGNAKM